MPKKKFFSVSHDLCAGRPPVLNPFIPATDENTQYHPMGNYDWSQARQCCEFHSLENICFGFNASLQLEVVVQPDANHRCTNGWIPWTSHSWPVHHPYYFPNAEDPRLDYGELEWAHYAIQNPAAGIPSGAQFLSNCQSNYGASHGGWTVWNGRGERIKECTWNALQAYNSFANPLDLAHWQSFYHRQILWEGGLRPGGTYEAEYNQHGANAFRASAPSDFPFIAAGPVTWDGRRCVRTFHFAKFFFQMAENISGSHPCTGFSQFNYIVPGMACQVYFFEPVSFPITIDVGCPFSYSKTVLPDVLGSTTGPTASYEGESNDQGLGEAAWDELPWPAPWPDAHWGLSACIVNGNGTTSRFYSARQSDVWYRTPDWAHHFCDAGGVPLERVTGPDPASYICHEPYVDYGCGFGYVLDPTDPLGLRCIPECLGPVCASGYTYQDDYPGYPGGEPGFPLPICVKSYESYITSGIPMGWARGRLTQLYRDGLRVYSDHLPEYVLYTRNGPGVISRRASGVIDFWVMEGLQDPAPPAIGTTFTTQLRHFWTADDGVTFLPLSGNEEYVYKEDLQLPGGSGTWHVSLPEEWRSWFQSHPLPDFIAGWRHEFDRQFLPDQWRVIYDPSGFRYVFAFHHTGSWWCREARQADPEDLDNWILSDEHHMIATPDYTAGDFSLDPSGALEFACYLVDGAGVLIKCSNLQDGKGDWL